MGNNKDGLAKECCLLYYEKKASQQEIAEILGISRTYVSRLLTYAEEKHLVKLHVEFVGDSEAEVRQQIDLTYKYPLLKKAYVLRSDNERDTMMNIGNFAVENTEGYLQKAESIGLSLGVHVQEYIKALNYSGYSGLKKKKIVQMTGNLYSYPNTWAQPMENVSTLARKTNSDMYFINAPLFTSNRELTKLLFQEKEIARTREQWKSIDVAILGIEGTQSFSKLKPVLSVDGLQEVKRYSAVGNVCVVFFDINGRIVPVMEEEKISIPRDEYQRIGTKIVIGTGESKIEAIKAACRGGLVDVLVTDSLTADRLLSEK